MFRGDYLPLCRWPLAWADCETAAGVDGPVWELNGKGEHSSDVESAGYIVPALQLYLSVMQIHTSGQVGSVRSKHVLAAGDKCHACPVQTLWQVSQDKRATPASTETTVAAYHW